MNSVLIVEDESIVALELDMYITSLGFNVVGSCACASGALSTIESKSVDIIIMDINIKGNMQGTQLAQVIKEKSPSTEIIFLTAHIDDTNIKEATLANPVAFLSKPFNQIELKAALKIAEHKLGKNRPNIKFPNRLIKLDQDFYYDQSSSLLYYLKKPIVLTKKEEELLKLFLNHIGNVVELDTISQNIWPDTDTNANTVRTLVKRLREKLKNRFITTIQSRGYIMHIAI